jgi:hypothetical protein
MLYSISLEIHNQMLKSSIFWDLMPCSPLKVNRRFGGTCGLHLQGRRIGKASKALLATCFISGLFFNPEDGGDMFLQSAG